jgi:hypothetical protein
MRRGLCRAVRGLLASTGLALGLSSQALAQLPPAASPVAIGVPEPDSQVPGAPPTFASAQPLPDATEPMISDGVDAVPASRW